MVYNNIISDAPDYGVINFGKGNVILENNYISNSKGVFIDNRTISDTSYVLEIRDNYFKSLTGQEVIRNMNEKNNFFASQNKYDTDIIFYNDLNGVDNEYISNNIFSQLSDIQFTNPALNDYSLSSNNASEYIGMGAPGGPEFLDYEDPATTPALLVITPDMLTDNVIGGSVDSPLFLFDEQNIDIEDNAHPISKSWKPFYYMEKDAYHTTVDLGDEHFISQINLHDMNDSHNFTVEYFDGTNWINLFQEPLDNYNQWIRNDVEINTRYLRFSMYDSPYAAVNEILIYGYSLLKESQQIIVNSSMMTDMVSGGSVDSPDFLFDEQNVDITTGEHPMSLSWKPWYNNSHAPYHAVLEMDQAYKLTKLALHDMHNTQDLVIETSQDGENWSVLYVEPCDRFNVWQETDVDIITKYLRFTMLDSPYASVNEILLFGYPVMTLPEENHNLENQIVISPDMVNDLVAGGSVDTPLYLFDEQSLNPELDQQPVSKNWRPFYNNGNAPYYTTIDLAGQYVITKIYIHDMHSTYDFNLEYDNASNWTPLLTEPCDSYNVWKVHEVNVTTSKLRLSMLDSPYAGVNEIILVGYPVLNRNSVNNTMKNNKTKSEVLEENLKPVLFPNPVKDNINLRLPLTSEAVNQNVKIYNISGQLIYSLDIDKNSLDANLKIETSNILSRSGLYLLKYKNDKGVEETIKFYKT